MRKYILLFVCLYLATIIHADTFVTAYEQDTVTPFDYRSIPVGTELTLIVTSDSDKDGQWWGSLATENENILRGALSPHLNDYDLSVYPQAGPGASISLWQESGIEGFDLYTDLSSAVAGKWFILDFSALAIGPCQIGFYDYDKALPYDNITVNIIPEPVTWALLGVGSIVLSRRRRAGL